MNNYYIGLDIGTESCGWAVTDENYNILRAKGKKLWGVRLFDPAVSAVSRRVKRASRRRLVRQKLRLDWFRGIFKPEIDKIDPNMLDRLKYSSLWLEDKPKLNENLTTKDSLFFSNVKEGLTDKKYFEDYKTIYHLRSELIDRPAEDVRLLYLAVHNIIKRRGHFLYEGDFENNGSIKKLINYLIDSFSEFDIDEINDVCLKKIDESEEEKIQEILISKIGLNQIKSKFNEIFNAKSKGSKSLVACFVNGKINLKDIFKIETEDDLKLNFNDEDFDAKFDTIKINLSEEQESFVLSVKQIFSIMQLRKLLNGRDYICQSMVDLYNEHKEQLKHFKDFIKYYHKSQYYKIFREPQDNFKKDKEKYTNYALYVNGSIFDGKKRVVNLNNSDRKKEEFYKFVKKVLERDVELEDYDVEIYNKEKQRILDAIENDSFLVKQRTNSNSVFPNKLYEKELKKILEVNAEKFEFLKERDESGLTNIEKILKILSFRIPYFVGPIGSIDGVEKKTGWITRDKKFDLKPWTLQKTVNFDEAEDKFITNMTNKCTYLKDKDVLPKNSIIFSKFKVLNELNKLKINGNEISVKLKQDIFTELFEKKPKVTLKTLKDFLVSNNYYTQEEIKEISITGIDKEFVNNYASYSKLVNLPCFDKTFVDKNLDNFEEVIKYHTIISDKTRLEKRIRNKFSHIFSEEQIKALKGFNYQGWGSLSKEFLTLDFANITANERLAEGEVTNILNELWETNQNLQEIIYNTNYELLEELQKYGEKQVDDIAYEQVDNLYCSPAVKRGVWQTIKILKEIINELGEKPKKIFIEVTRHDEEKGDKGRKLSRQTNLLNMYQSKEFKDVVEKLGVDLGELLNELNHKNNNELRSEKLYLYFLQLGRCAYSGNKIDIKDLFDDNLYDIDHIIPRSKRKDDSINNKVLVEKTLNETKSDNFPIYSIRPDWVIKQKDFWKQLVKLKLMSQEKFDRLVRTDDLSDDEMGSFIARQLVETNQSNMAVIELLKSYLGEETKIIYSKAKFVSEFRNNYDIPKSRLVNDLHHAKDAYLNIVVGNVINNRFTDDPRNFYKYDNENKVTKKTDELFNYVIRNWHDRNDIVWNGKKDIERIKDICYKNDCLVTRMSYVKENGDFYDETVYKSKKNDEKQGDLIPLKGDMNNPLSNVERYGGYNKLKTAYFMVVESKVYKKKKKEIITETIKTIEMVPRLIVQKYKNDSDKEQKIFEYVVSQNNLIDAKVIVPKLKIKSTLKIGNGLYWLAGKTGSQFILHNANQWFVNQNQTKYVKAIEKYIELKIAKKDSSLEEIENKVILSKKKKNNNKEICLTKEENLSLYNKIIEQLSKNIYAGLSLSDSLRQKLIDKKDYFENELNVINQAQCLHSILKSLSTGAEITDLSLLKEGSSVGKILINKNITDKDIVLIEQSQTGLCNKYTRL